MSRTVDERVVSMQFDNKQFENNAQTSIKTLDKLKSSLNLEGSAKGLQEIDAASKKVDMSALSNGVETVRAKFSALQVMAVTALSNITNSAVNAGKRIASALVIDPIKTGFSEYETKIGSIQTIMSNTASKGTTMEDVTRVIDELNTYADKTIYNFAEMTRNIGTFTAAGIGLEESASSIQGIANLAAASGSTSQQASTAMYQLSQAMAAGTVKLMDWNSVVNAGMGGEKFQEALKATARDHGIAVDEIIKKNGSFRESLSEGWISAKLLNETLNKFTVEGAKKYAQSMMESGKWTQEQADALIKEAQSMEDAATKVKTFTQLWDTLKESAQSGWGRSWEIIIGNFDEAKELWTKVSEVIGGMINDSADARNKILEGWADGGGRLAAIESIKNVFEGIMSLVKPIKEAFREIFPPVTAKRLIEITNRIKELTAKFKLNEEQAEKLKTTFKGIFSVFDITFTIIKEIVGGIVKLLKNFSGLGNKVLTATSVIGSWINKVRTASEETGIFGLVIGKIVGFLQKAIDKVKEFISAIKQKFSSPSAERLIDIFTGLWTTIKNIVGKIVDFVASIGKQIGTAFRNGDVESAIGIFNAGIFSAILLGIQNFIGNITNTVKGVKEMFGGFAEVLGSVKDVFQSWQKDLQANILLKIAGAIAILAISLMLIASIDPDRLGSALVGITALLIGLVSAMKSFGKISFDKKINKATRAMLVMSISIAILAKAVATMGQLSWGELIRGLTGMAVSLIAMIGAMKLMPKEGMKRSTGLIAMATAIVIMGQAVKTMGGLSWGELARGLLGMATGLIAMVGAIRLMPNKGTIGKGIGLIALATAMVIVSNAIKTMGALPWEHLIRGLTGLAISLIAMVGAMKLMPKGMISKAIGMIGIATAITILGNAIKNIGSLSWSSIAKGLTGLAISLIAIVGALRLMPKGMMGKALSLIIIAGAIASFSKTITKMGGLSWGELAKGLIALGVSLGMLAGGLHAMHGTGGASVSLLVASVALGALANVMKKIGKMSWGDIAKGLIALAGAFTILGLATKILTPVIGSMLKLSIAMLAFGAAAALLGAGILAISIALGSLGANLLILVSSIVEIIATVVKGLGEIIVSACNAIIAAAPAIAQAIVTVVVAACEALKGAIPAILETLVVLFESFREYIPKIVNILADFIVQIFDSLADRIPEIVASAVNLVSKFLLSLKDALKQLGVENLIGTIASVAGIFIALGLTAKVVSTIPVAAAVKGVAAMAILIAGVAAILAALGGLAQIQGFDWLLSEGSKILSIIGTAIGTFVGNIIGGFMGGVSSGFVTVGENLSAFMIALQPFLDGARSIDPSVAEGIKALAVAVLALTAASFLDTISSFLGGGPSLAKLGEQLVPFGKAMADFAKVSADIDTEKLTNAAEAGKAIGEMYDSIPSLSGVISWFTGGNNLGKLGEQLVPFGEAMMEFSEAVTGMDTASITTAVGAGKELGGLYESIPKTSGVISWFTGGNNMGKLAQQLVPFGEAMKEFSAAVVGLDREAITTAVSSGKELGALYDSIPSVSGVVSWFTGGNNLGKLGEQLVPFGEAMMEFSEAVTGMDTESITVAVEAGKALAGLEESCGALTGVVSWFTGGSNLIALGEQIVPFGKAMSDFSMAISTGSFDSEKVLAAVEVGKALASMHDSVGSLTGVISWFTGGNNLADLGEQLVPFGKAMVDFCTTIGTAEFNPESVTAAVMAGKELAGLEAAVDPLTGVVSWFTGGNNLAALGEQLTPFGEAMAGFCAAVSGKDFNTESVIAAVEAGKALAGMEASVGSLSGVVSWFTGQSNLATLGEQLVPFAEAMVGFCTTVSGKEFDTEKVESAVEAGKALAGMEASVGSLSGVISWFTGQDNLSTLGEQLVPFGEALAGFSEAVSAKEFNAEKVTAAANVGKKLAEMSDLIPKLTSWWTGENKMDTFADQLVPFGEAIAGFSAEVADIEITAVNTASSAGKKLGEMAGLVPKKSNLEAFGGQIEKFGSSMSTFAGTVSGINPESMDSVVTTFKSVINKLVEIGKNSVDDIFEPFTNSAASSKMSTAMASLVNSMKDGLSAKHPTIKSAVTTLMTKFIEGIKEKYTAITSAFNSPIASAVSSLRAKWSSFYSAGAYLVQGFCNGITANTFMAEARSRAMAGAAADAAKEELDEHSPSKVGYEIGDFFGIAFVNAIGDNVSKAYDASTEMAGAAKNGLSNAINKVKSYIENGVDAQPTIRPVLDLSAVAEGAGSINGLFDMNPSIGVMSNIRSISSMMNNRQNGVNDDVVSAINDLGKKINNASGNVYNVNGVTYDDGSNVSTAVQSLIRAARIERRV